MFAIVGMVFGTWAVRIPAIRDALSLSAGTVSVALLALAAGSIVGLVTSGVLVSRFGGRRVVRAGLVVYCLALPIVGLTGGLAALIGALVVFGFGKGLMDVASNSQGVRIERAYPTQIMGSFHAVFSGGGVLGAVVGSVVVALGLSVEAHFTLVSVVSLVIGLVVSRWLLENDPSAAGGQHFALPSRKLAGFCAIGFCALFIEGVGNDWSTVFLESAAGAEASIAALGFGVFSLTMMAGRFLADRIVHRIGSKRFIRLAAGVAAIGLALTLVVQTTVSLIGFGILGLGLAGVMPVAMSMAGNHDSETPTESAVAAVSTAGYGGFAIGPVAIGVLADASSLQVAFLPALGLAVAIVLLTLTLPTVAQRVDQTQGSPADD
ncbi:MFS transporter [Halococcus salsus]|uniref:MFS transporter n=1 Tax=Halococcus salsus TaxID=2162894 RepID=UPI001F0455FC|nr:MFS transporter [Halococcus salsus]